MERLDERTVKLNDREARASQDHDELLDGGVSTLDATIQIHEKYGDSLNDGYPLTWQ